MSHSILPPSSAHIWGAPNGCTGWVTMVNSVPEDFRNIKNTKSIEGDVAHELAAKMIDAAARAGIETPLRNETIGTELSGVVVTEEMFDSCELYVEDVKKVMQDSRIFGGAFMGIEERVAIWGIHKECFGTVDTFIYDIEKKIIYVWDFKYGHLYVDEYENWQAICYVAGIIARLAANGFTDPELKIKIRIVQPRAYHANGPIREWSINAVDLYEYVKILKENAAIALSTGATNRTGSHCRYCDARHVCLEALEAGLSLYEAVCDIQMIQNLSHTALSVQYSIIKRAKEQIECLESGFQEQIKCLLKTGKDVPGYELTPAIGRERWDRPDSEIIAMGDMLGQDLRNIKAITPNQARKKHVNEDILKSFATRPNNGVKLTESNNKLATKIFLQE